jgi:hypothetical protein
MFPVSEWAITGIIHFGVFELLLVLDDELTSVV